MTVHLAGTLPDNDVNGLASIERALVDGHLRGDRHLVLGVVTVTGLKAQQKEGFKPNPIVSLVHVEAVPDEDAERMMGRLQAYLAARTGGDKLNFPESPSGWDEPLALTARAAGYAFVVADAADTDGAFSLSVIRGEATVLTRHQLPRPIYGEIPPGTYKLEHLDGELRDLAGDLVAEYESSFGEDLADAEVVGEDEAGEQGEEDQ